MPLARYFLYVGGVLLALLFVADMCLPKLPVGERANIDVPAIRIYSDQKWPDWVVYDTSRPLITPAQPPEKEINVSAPATVADASAKARDAFAKLQPFETNHPQPSDPGKRHPKLQRENIAKRHAPRQARLVWRQPQFGWCGPGIW
jgi:hypothetical protein